MLPCCVSRSVSLEGSLEGVCDDCIRFTKWTTGSYPYVDYEGETMEENSIQEGINFLKLLSNVRLEWLSQGSFYAIWSV